MCNNAPKPDLSEAKVRIADAEPLRVLHLLSSFEAGGVSRSVLTLTAGLVSAGHHVTCAGASGAWRQRFEQSPATAHLIPLNHGPLGVWRSGRQLQRDLADQHIDLIHAHHRRASLLGRRLARTLARGDAAARIPLLFSLHMPNIPISAPWRWLSDFGDHTLTFSDEARDWLTGAAGVARQRISVIPHGIAPEQFPQADENQRRHARRELALPEDAPVAAFVGRLSASKQPHWLLDLAAEAKRRELSALHIVVLGDGPEQRDLTTRLEREGLGDTVHLLGAGDPMSVYQACDLLLLPSRIESFALVCAEAMSVGRAVLRTRTGGWREQIIENATGRAVEVDRDAFVEAAIEMLGDRAGLHRMGEHAAAHVRAHLRFDRQLERTVALYRELIAAHRRRG